MQTNNASSNSQDKPTIPFNILAALSKFPHQAVVTDGRDLHPLAPLPQSSELQGILVDYPGAKHDVVSPVRELLAKMPQLSYSLNASMGYPISDQRLVTLYKENSGHEHTIRKAARTARLALDALKAPYEKAALSNHFRPSFYGLSIPLLRSNLASFILSCLEKWANEAKLEYFLDESHTSLPDTPQKLVVSLTKEDLLVDLEFERHPLAQDRKVDLSQNHGIIPLSLKVVNVHMTDREESSSSGNNRIGGSLPMLLKETVHRFLREVGCADGISQRDVDPRRAEIAATDLVSLFKELCWMAETVKAEGKEDPSKGMNWWDIIPKLTETFFYGLNLEVEAIKSQQPTSKVPLDVLLLRGHGIPVPFLASFSLSILLHLPPLGYLSLLRSPSKPAGNDPTELANVTQDDSSNFRFLDVPIEQVRRLLSSRDAIEKLRISLATLAFDPGFRVHNQARTQSPDEHDTTMFIPNNNFLLSEDKKIAVKARFEALSLPNLISTRDGDASGSGMGSWTLTFRTGGVDGPLILSQARMRRVAKAVGLISKNMDHDLGSDLAMLGFGTASSPLGPSWLDLTIDPRGAQPSRVYTSRYRPNSSGAKGGKAANTTPEVLSTLMPVNETGLALGSVAVRTLQEAYSVLEIVKEQLWLNELLIGVGFRPGYISEDLNQTNTSDVTQGEAKAMYDALISGSYIPQRIRATYEVLNDGRTGIKVSFPDKGTVVTIEVTLDLGSPLGTSVTVNGERAEKMEEVLRRGGLLALVVHAKTRL